MADQPVSEVSILIGRLRDGEPDARDELLPLVYNELEAIARAYTHGASSLDPRGLVHELYLRLVNTPLEPRDRKHFFAIAALAMRQILADRARKKRAAKRGGGDAERVPLTGLATGGRLVDLLVVEDVLARLEAVSPRQARIVELRCLLGMSVAEIADAIEVSPRTVHAEWQLARAWLVRELGVQ
ncbi:MAG TPA: ECF-type sigma factor [Kofleriaceae bacterium]|jgi:RNA polymerase sigma factor (TIGR02999 family)|nr:ECF-type sigma factor [Kofleriaceae bacterium]